MSYHNQNAQKEHKKKNLEKEKTTWLVQEDRLSMHEQVRVRLLHKLKVRWSTKSRCAPIERRRHQRQTPRPQNYLRRAANELEEISEAHEERGEK